MARDGIVELRHGAQSLGLNPGAGGQIAWYRSRLGDGATWHWLRPAPTGSGDPLQAACFPLTPFCNRIDKARFSYRSREIHLRPNKSPEPHAIHGLGWQGAWSVEVRDETSVTLRFVHDGGDWPWRFESRFTYRLGDEGLAVIAETRNLDSAVMPSGLGLHPYFPRGGEVRLKATVGAVVLTDDAMIPRSLAPGDPLIAAFRNGVRLPIGYDNGLEDWRGDAEITWPAAGHAMTLRADAAISRAVFYSPESESFFCFEPVSHLWNAHNRVIAGGGDGGLVHLAPGETQRMTVAFALHPTVDQ